MFLSFDKIIDVQFIKKRSIMDFYNNEDVFYADEHLIFGTDNEWDCDGCPPPVFNLPPPPRPPWLEDLDDCGSREESLADMLAQLETCDNTIIRDSQTLFQDTFHSVAVIVVSSIVLVMFVLVAGIMIFKRRKRLHNLARECHPAHPLVGGHHQFSMQKDLPPPHQQQHSQFSSQDPFDHRGTMLGYGLSKLPQASSTLGHKSMRAVTALTRNGHTMTRCCGNLEAHFLRHYNHTDNLASSLPNHYIPDVPPFPRATQVRPRLSVPDRTVMELSERPPQVSSVVQPNAYPHIIIGGKPFYLIPTSNEDHLDASNIENYSYPQHIPIYEEIDSSTYGKAFYEPGSEHEFSSEQGEVGSIERLSHPVRGSPRQLRTVLAEMARPVSAATSHSQNSSQQTNTSEVSSTSSTNSTNLTSTTNFQHYVILDPELEQADERKRKLPSFSSLYENNLARKSPNLSRSSNRSPQSIYSAKLALKNSQCCSPNKSVYYYSDTVQRQDLDTSGDSKTLIEDLKVEVQNEGTEIPQTPKGVNTVIVLEDPKSSSIDKKGNATLV